MFFYIYSLIIIAQFGEYMFTLVHSAAVLGINAYVVKVETHIEGNLPYFAMVGLPEGAVREARERVQSAVKNSEIKFPLKRIIINLAPADVKKEGAAFDLPLAVGILSADGIIKSCHLQEYGILGELGLDGQLRPIRGALSIAVEFKKREFKGLIIPEQNAREAALVGGLDVIPVRTLEQAIMFLNDQISIEPFKVDNRQMLGQHQCHKFDFMDVKGQEHAKRALEVAAAGGHNVIMIGPPGSGKTMLAKRIPTILPDMSLAEALETTKIHSVAGILNNREALITNRPFRSPHHTISDAGLIGGGTIPKPGEVSLAHHGVLFLDELPEFKKNVLEVLRQPLEDGQVTISRALLSLTYPATFMLAAAMNPCPCGYHTDPNRTCTCSIPNIQRYMAKISGPLLDRIDIHLDVPTVKYKELASNRMGEPSKNIRERVERARKRQQHRFADSSHTYCNARMESREIRRTCRLDGASEELMRTAITSYGLSARAYDRILKVARTIADLDESSDIKSDHISEAIQYRTLDRSLIT